MYNPVINQHSHFLHLHHSFSISQLCVEMIRKIKAALLKTLWLNRLYVRVSARHIPVTPGVSFISAITRQPNTGIGIRSFRGNDSQMSCVFCKFRALCKQSPSQNALETSLWTLWIATAQTSGWDARGGVAWNRNPFPVELDPSCSSDYLTSEKYYTE